MHVNITVTVIVVAYMLIMLYIGWASSKRIKSNSDFMVAGRRLGPILMAGTLTATEIGGGSSLGVVQNGMSGYGLTSAWYIIAIGIAFIIMSFLAPMFRKTEIKTVPEYFRRRYGKGIGLITSIVTFIPLVGLTAGQFIAAAVVLSTMLGINYKMAVIITAGVVTAYSIMGGLWSVSITDNVQMVLIIFGMAIAIPFALSYAGGWSAVTANIPEGTLSLVGGENGGYDIISIIGLVVMYVATFSVGQEAVSRFYAAKDRCHHAGPHQYGQVQRGRLRKCRRPLRSSCPCGGSYAGLYLRSSVRRHYLRDNVLFRLRPARCRFCLCK